MKYKVLQPFIDYENLYYSQGSTFCPDYKNLTTHEQDFIEHLEQCMFIEEIPHRPKTVWDLKEGDAYWFIDALNVIDEKKWDNSFFDKQSRIVGSTFLSKEEAKKELARRKAKQVLLRDTKGFKPDWKSGGYNYEIYYDYESYMLNTTDHRICSNHPDLWFATREDAEASIEAHEKEWKIYLGVDDEKL